MVLLFYNSYFREEETFLSELSMKYALSADAINILWWEEISSQSALTALSQTDIQQLQLSKADTKAVKRAVYDRKQQYVLTF